MKLETVIEILRRHCAAAGSQRAWANSVGISAPFVSDVLRGNRKPGPALLDALGLEEVTEYREKERADG